jgi:glutamate carboxypeptidase
MNSTSSIVQWVSQQQPSMTGLLRELCEINSGTDNLPGVVRVTSALLPALQRLGGTIRHIDLPFRTTIDNSGQIIRSPLAPAISIRKRPEAPCRVFLGIHIDTVYPQESHFQHVNETDSNRWTGPGIADAKGGLVIMLTALEALERSDAAGNIGWEVLINTDEEIGSPGSAHLFAEAARRNHFGLIFEPALPDGNLVSARKGSWNYALIIRGRSAHVGRDISAGRNAIHAMAHCVTTIAGLQDLDRGVTVNVGRIDGGSPANVVPDLAIGRFNVRTNSLPDLQAIDLQLRSFVKALNVDGIFAELIETSSCPPKPVDDATTKLFEAVAGCGKDLGLNLSWSPSGGVCDGNRLAAAGLPTIDTMGPRGGNLHSDSEFIMIDSLVERASLTALVLSGAAVRGMGFQPMQAV